MAKANILVADNEPDYLETVRDFLQREGFRVLPAASPAEAVQILEQGGVDLAVIDIRLVNDNDERDTSGLGVVKKYAPHVPKILLTRWPRYEDVREALSGQLDGLPNAVDFVAKQEGVQSLLTAINRALHLVTRYREMSDNLARRINLGYDDARQQSKWNYWFSLAASVIGMTIIFVGAYLAVNGYQPVAIPTTVAGVLAQGIAVLFFKRVDLSNVRIDARHRELMEIKWLDTLMAACDDFSTEEKQESYKGQVINAATQMWLTSGSRRARAGRLKAKGRSAGDVEEGVGR